MNLSYSPKNEEKSKVVMLPTLDDIMQKKRNAANKEAVSENMLSAAGSGDGSVQRESPQEAAARAAAQKIIEEAHAQAKLDAQKIIDEANLKREAIFEKAREEGFASGRVEVFAQAADALELLDDGYRVAIENLVETSAQLFTQLQPQMLDTAIQIAQRIMHIEFDRNDEAYKSIVNKALLNVLNQKNIVLRVSDWEYKRFFAEGAGALALALEAREIKVCRDALLDKSECKVETEYGDISVGIEIQLKRLGHALATNW